MCDLQINKDGKDQETIQSSTTSALDTAWESIKNTTNTTNKSQEDSHLPSRRQKGSNEQTRTHGKQKTQKHKWSTKDAPPQNVQ